MVNPLIFAGIGITGMITWMAGHREPVLELMNIQDIQLVAEGLLQGALEVEGLTDVVECVEDSDQLIIDIRHAVGHFR